MNKMFESRPFSGLVGQGDIFKNKFMHGFLSMEVKDPDQPYLGCLLITAGPFCLVRAYLLKLVYHYYIFEICVTLTTQNIYLKTLTNPFKGF